MMVWVRPTCNVTTINIWFERRYSHYNNNNNNNNHILQFIRCEASSYLSPPPSDWLWSTPTTFGTKLKGTPCLQTSVRPTADGLQSATKSSYKNAQNKPQVLDCISSDETTSLKSGNEVVLYFTSDFGEIQYESPETNDVTAAWTSLWEGHGRRTDTAAVHEDRSKETISFSTTMGQEVN